MNRRTSALAFALTVVTPLSGIAGEDALMPLSRDARVEPGPGDVPSSPLDLPFEKRYPDPMIHRSWDIPGSKTLKVIEVFDRSQLAEDPIGTSLWIAHPDGRKEPLTTKGLERAIAEQKITAKTAKDAWTIAVLPAVCQGYLQHVWLSGQPQPTNTAVPAEVWAKLPKKSVKRVKGGFDVELASVEERRGFMLGAPVAFAFAWKVELRGSEVRYVQRTVWSTFGGEEEAEPVKAAPKSNVEGKGEGSGAP